MTYENWIGPWPFISLSGQIEPPKRELEIIQRPGVAGTGIFLLGVKGKPFTVRSKVDVLDAYDGRRTFDRYTDLVGNNPVQLVWLSLTMSTAIPVNGGFFVEVLDVHNPLILRLQNSSEGTLGWLEADWDLIAI